MEKSIIDYKFNEDELIRQLKDYIDSTYNQHYAQGRIQTTEFIQANGDGIPFTRGNIIKYAQRYGNKEGRNRKDILKVLHYAIIMLHTHDYEEALSEQQSEEINYENQSRHREYFEKLRNNQHESII